MNPHLDKVIRDNPKPEEVIANRKTEEIDARTKVIEKYQEKEALTDRQQNSLNALMEQQNEVHGEMYQEYESKLSEASRLIEEAEGDKNKLGEALLLLKIVEQLEKNIQQPVNGEKTYVQKLIAQVEDNLYR